MKLNISEAVKQVHGDYSVSGLGILRTASKKKDLYKEIATNILSEIYLIDGKAVAINHPVPLENLIENMFERYIPTLVSISVRNSEKLSQYSFYIVDDEVDNFIIETDFRLISQILFPMLEANLSNEALDAIYQERYEELVDLLTNFGMGIMNQLESALSSNRDYMQYDDSDGILYYAINLQALRFWKSNSVRSVIKNYLELNYYFAKQIAPNSVILKQRLDEYLLGIKRLDAKVLPNPGSNKSGIFDPRNGFGDNKKFYMDFTPLAKFIDLPGNGHVRGPFQILHCFMSEGSRNFFHTIFKQYQEPYREIPTISHSYWANSSALDGEIAGDYGQAIQLNTNLYMSEEVTYRAKPLSHEPKEFRQIAKAFNITSDDTLGEYLFRCKYSKIKAAEERDGED